MIREYFTCVGWISSLFCLLFFNFKYLYTISYITMTNLQHFFAIMWQKLKNFQHRLAPFKVSWRLCRFWCKKAKKTRILLFQEGRKLELLANIFTLVITKHTIEFSQAILYAIVYHLKLWTIVNIPIWIFSAWLDNF